MENETSQSYSSKGFDHPDIEKEIAFHEAGHFVFICMMRMHLKDFSPIRFAVVCKEKFGDPKENGNGISGGEPTMNKDGFEDSVSKNLQDKKRMTGQIFSLLAGVTTYHEFIEKTDYFVGIPKYEEQRLNYYTFQDAFKLNFDDFKEVYKLLKYVEPFGYKIPELAEKILQGTIELMQNSAVREAIDLVCQKLLQSPCVKIEGSELDAIVGTVEHLISKVPYMEILVKYAKILEEREQALQEQNRSYEEKKNGQWE